MSVHHRVISADSHVIEPRDLWERYIEPPFRDRAPRVERVKGADRWVCEGIRLHTLRELAGVRRALPGFELTGDYESDVAPGGYDPDARLAEQDRDGIDGEVVYPTVALRMFAVEDFGFQQALFRAYNSWVAEYCSAHPDRLRGVGAVCMQDVEGAARELRRCKELGLVGGLVVLEGGQHHLPGYRPFWAAAAELEMPISLHVDTGQAMKDVDTVEQVVYPVHVQRVLAAMLYSDLFDRFPRLRLVCVESDAGWAGNFIERMDLFYGLEHREARGISARRPPGEIFRESISLVFMTDLTGIQSRNVIGIDNLMWSNDYPHAVSTWPRSRETIRRQFQGVPAAEVRKIICDNAVEVFAFS